MTAQPRRGSSGDGALEIGPVLMEQERLHSTADPFQQVNFQLTTGDYG
jgi:hypothetical protein